MFTSRLVPIPLASALTALLLIAPASRAADFDGALSWLPAEVSTIVAFDLEGARKAAFFKDLEKGLIDASGASRDLSNFKRDTGVDLLASVKSVVFAGTDDALKKGNQGLVILEGTFDEAKLKDAYTKKSKTPLTPKTGPAGAYYQVGSEACVMLSGAFALIGPRALFEKAMDAKAKKTGGKGLKVASMLARLKSSKHGFAVIASSAQVKKALGKDFAEAQDVNASGLGFDFSSGLKLELIGLFSDATKANAVASRIKSELSKIAKDPDMKELGLDATVAKIAASSSGPEVKVELSLTPTDAKALAKDLKDLL
jgi:hypothetical protein